MRQNLRFLLGCPTDIPDYHDVKRQTPLLPDSEIELDLNMEVLDERGFGIRGSRMARLGATAHICRQVLADQEIVIDYYNRRENWTRKVLETANVVIIEPGQSKWLVEQGVITTSDLLILNLSDEKFFRSYSSYDSWYPVGPELTNMSEWLRPAENRIIWTSSGDHGYSKAFATQEVTKVLSAAEEVTRKAKEQAAEAERIEAEKRAATVEEFFRCRSALWRDFGNLDAELRQRLGAMRTELRGFTGRCTSHWHSDTSLESWNDKRCKIARADIEVMTAKMEPLLADIRLWMKADAELRETQRALLTILLLVKQALWHQPDKALSDRVLTLVWCFDYTDETIIMDWMSDVWEVMEYIRDNCTQPEHAYMRSLAVKALSL